MRRGFALAGLPGDRPVLVPGAVALVALAHLGLLLTPTGRVVDPMVLGVELGLLVVIGGLDLLAGARPARTLVLVGWVAGALAVGLALTLWLAPAVAAGVLLAGGLLLAYGIHRYELVALDLVEVPVDE